MTASLLSECLSGTGSELCLAFCTCVRRAVRQLSAVCCSSPRLTAAARRGLNPLEVALTGFSLLFPLESMARTGLQRVAVVDAKVGLLESLSRHLLFRARPSAVDCRALVTSVCFTSRGRLIVCCLLCCLL
jgi:hypothetical protein